jgi:hypothetical protein
MADEKFYEQKLSKAFVDTLNAKQDANKFAEVAEKKVDLIGSICARISTLINISVSEARTYIDLCTGKFRSGRYMPHCLDPKLIELFSQLEVATKERKKYPFHSIKEAVDYANSKAAEAGKIIEEIKGLFPHDTAKGICARAKATAIQTTGISF